MGIICCKCCKENSESSIDDNEPLNPTTTTTPPTTTTSQPRDIPRDRSTNDLPFGQSPANPVAKFVSPPGSSSSSSSTATVVDFTFLFKIKEMEYSNFFWEMHSSFNIGRILYAVLEHSFKQRENDEQRTYFDLTALVAPYKCSILPLTAAEPVVNLVREELTKQPISYRMDESAISIGRRYARTDELGIPFAVTVDFDSVEKPHTVTLRDLSSMQQVRLEIAELAKTLSELCCGKLNWCDVTNMFHVLEAKKED